MCDRACVAVASAHCSISKGASCHHPSHCVSPIILSPQVLCSAYRSLFLLLYLPTFLILTFRVSSNLSINHRLPLLAFSPTYPRFTSPILVQLLHQEKNQLPSVCLLWMRPWGPHRSWKYGVTGSHVAESLPPSSGSPSHGCRLGVLSPPCTHTELSTVALFTPLHPYHTLFAGQVFCLFCFVSHFKNWYQISTLPGSLLWLPRPAPPSTVWVRCLGPALPAPQQPNSHPMNLFQDGNHVEESSVPSIFLLCTYFTF